MTAKTLIERLEGAEGPSRELDAEIEALFTDERGNRPLKFFFNQVQSGHRRPPRFSSSIDAALTLVPEGWEWRLDNDTSGECAPYRFGMGQNMDCEAATPALAICIASLRARGQG